MGHNDHIDFELHELIEELVDSGELEEGSPSYGIAQQVIHSGYESLSDRQKYTYDKYVIPALEALGEEHRINAIVNSAMK